jgi:transposase
MFSLSSALSYFLYRNPVDIRNSFDGLSGLIQNELGRDPLSGEVFIFMNKRRNQVKLLRWEQGGFILYYKRLETGTFELPQQDNDSSDCPLQWSTLVMMIEGISLKNIQKRERFIFRKIA